MTEINSTILVQTTTKESLMEVNSPMSEKPLHYDGSIQANENSSAESIVSEPFTLTDEMRMNISANPYTFEINK